MSPWPRSRSCCSDSPSAAWVPEPYVAILTAAGGKVLLTEADLCPEGEFINTQLIVRTEFLEEHPDLVADLLAAHVESTSFINDNPGEAKTTMGEQLLELAHLRRCTHRDAVGSVRTGVATGQLTIKSARKTA